MRLGGRGRRGGKRREVWKLLLGILWAVSVQLLLPGPAAEIWAREIPVRRHICLRETGTLTGEREKKGAGFGENPERGSLPGMEDFDFSEVNRFLEDGEGKGLTMEAVMDHLARGDLAGLCRETAESLKSSLLAEVLTGGRLMGQVLALGLLGAVFTNFSTVFRGGEISETGFFITYLLLFTFLAASVMESMAVASGTVKKILEFMRLLMPSYFLAVAFAGGSVSAVAMYEFTLWIMAAGQWFLGSMVLPVIKLYVLLSMAGNLVKEEFLSKLTELLGQAAAWGMKLLPGLVLSFHVIQSMILPYVDSLKQGAVRRAVSMIPGVGQGAAAMTQLLVGSGVLIKNTMGMAAMVILMILIAMPVLKMLVLMVMYQCVAAVMEPVCDKRLVSCVEAAARGQKLMVQAVVAAALILVITVAVVCAGTNVTYFG